jgi:hypothetical protein
LRRAWGSSLLRFSWWRVISSGVQKIHLSFGQSGGGVPDYLPGEGETNFKVSFLTISFTMSISRASKLLALRPSGWLSPAGLLM